MNFVKVILGRFWLEPLRVKNGNMTRRYQLCTSLVNVPLPGSTYDGTRTP